MELQKELIEAAWLDRQLLRDPATGTAIVEVLEALDQGQIRVAQEEGEGWKVNEWVKKAVILYFPLRGMEVTEAGPLEFHDKIPVKRGYAEKGIRVVPHAVARYGAYISPGVVLMPSYVNIGAWIGAGTMVETWATVGS